MILHEPQSSINTTPPIDPKEGDIWYDPSINRNLIYKNGSWRVITFEFVDWKPINKLRKETIKDILK